MDERSLVLKIEGLSVGKGRIPFSLLVKILKGIQEIIYLVALSEQCRDIKKRARIPSNIQRSCELIRVLESPGSYEILASLPEPQQRIMFSENDYDIGIAARRKLLELMDAVSISYNDKHIEDIIPDSSYRKRILKTIESFSPRPGQDWSLYVGGRNGEPYGYVNSETRKNVSRLLVGQWLEHRTITGELMRIHLDEKSFGIRYKPTDQVLICYYDPDLEDIIINNLRGVVRVTGTVKLDHNGHPEKVVNVYEIDEVDLSPISFSRIASDGIELVLKKPIEVIPELNEQEVIIEFQELNIISSGETVDEAVMELQSDIVWLWKEYAKEEDDALSVDAIKLKYLLLDMVAEEHHEQ
ncbi:hypothetical protein [Desulfurispora thermophila]|uniref:hypothetical protein n=1 Tax=Desulfurispora thermophila TaxID=265470 RepID=UPI000370B928|nr:hypothetical protein [Desulfurispora thermophila]